VLKSARVTQDEHLHEFRLEGKPLAFLIISAIVVSVVVFLCGVMVGRGVRSRTIDPVEVAAASIVDPTQSSALLEEVPEAKDSTAGAEAALTYPGRLEGTSAPDPLDEPLNPPRTKTAPEPPVPPAPAQAQPAQKSAEFREPSGKGYVVQVMSVTEMPAAERAAGRLKSKGYRSFVSESAGKYRVRVGLFAEKREAMAVANRLEKEERFGKPWVTTN
jgi:cell division septation protein DedD